MSDEAITMINLNGELAYIGVGTDIQKNLNNTIATQNTTINQLNSDLSDYKTKLNNLLSTSPYIEEIVEDGTIKWKSVSPQYSAKSYVEYIDNIYILYFTLLVNGIELEEDSGSYFYAKIYGIYNNTSILINNVPVTLKDGKGSYSYSTYYSNLLIEIYKTNECSGEILYTNSLNIAKEPGKPQSNFTLSLISSKGYLLQEDEDNTTITVQILQDGKDITTKVYQYMLLNNSALSFRLSWGTGSYYESSISSNGEFYFTVDKSLVGDKATFTCDSCEIPLDKMVEEGVL